jgi:Domain of unknown function (DUF4166)/Saccharopine dehydrogenase NADP binding domain
VAVRILIVGGYGTFGGRLARLLVDDRRVALLIAGRSLEKAAAFCAELPPGAQRQPLAFDRDGDVALQLAGIKPDLVVDTSGPFQSYGDDPYRLVRAALALGIDYLDIADSAEFVGGIGQFDAAARARGVFILAGGSSYPVLTAAVVRHLARDIARIETISAGIAPSPNPSAIGPTVLRAIADYAGKPVNVIRDGHPVVRYALTESIRYTIAPPGRLPLGSRRFSLVDVPDLHVLPALWPEVKSVWMGAGPVPAMHHRIFNFCAWLVRLGLIPSLRPAADLFYRIYSRLTWGEHRGGMFVAVAGVARDGQGLERSWHLLADGNDGPFIPSMAAAAIIRHCLDGRRPAPGARSPAKDLELGDYDPFFDGRAIHHGIREITLCDRSMPLYRRLLGEAWPMLPAALQTMHGFTERLTAEGLGTVERGRGLLARIIAALFRFPRPGNDVPVRVDFERRGDVEIWRRTFARRSFASVQFAGAGRSDKLIVERFGPFAIGLAAVMRDDRLWLVPRRWSFLGLPLPSSLLPVGDGYEFAEQDRFQFHVEIGHKLTGLIVRYRGWLKPVA